VGVTKYACNSDLSMLVKVRTLNVTLNANQMRHVRQIRMCSSVKHRPGCWMRDSVCEHVIHGRSGIGPTVGISSRHASTPRHRRRRRVYFGSYRNNPDNNGMDQIVTIPIRAALAIEAMWLKSVRLKYVKKPALCPVAGHSTLVTRRWRKLCLSDARLRGTG